MADTFTHNEGHLHTKAIYVVGPSSTGKTTLCNALAKQLGLGSGMLITEVARTVMKEKRFSRADVGSLAMQHAIVKAQTIRDHEARQRAVERTGLLETPVISDRSAVDAVVYSALSGTDRGVETLVASAELQEILPYYRSSRTTFVLLRPIPEWRFDDGVRSLEDGESCHAMFVKTLNELNIRYIEIGEDCRMLEERVILVRRASCC